MKNFIKRTKAMTKPFVFSRGKFQPVYFWATVFNALIVLTWVMKLFQQKILISDSLLLGILTFVVVWLGVYNWYRVKTETPPAPEPSTTPVSIPSIPRMGKMMKGDTK